MQDTGKLEAIWIKRFKQGPMDACDSAEISKGKGLKDNANQGGKRAITIISQDQWREIMGELSADLDPSTRRANLMVSSIDLPNSRGKILQIGEARIRIWGETRPCHLMEAALAGLQETMKPEWRGGAFGEPLNDAEISVGDSVQWMTEEAPESSVI